VLSISRQHLYNNVMMDDGAFSGCSMQRRGKGIYWPHDIVAGCQEKGVLLMLVKFNIQINIVTNIDRDIQI